MNILMYEHRPADSLQPYIETYWKATFNVAGEPGFSHHIVPNGCIELIIHLTDHHCKLRREGNSYDRSPPFTLMGIYDRPYIVRFPSAVRTFGIRFHPDGFRHLLGVPPGAFVSTYEDGVSVAGKQLEQFCERIREELSTDRQVMAADRFFTEQLARQKKSRDFTHDTMDLIRKTNGLIRINELNDAIPVSPRQLQRLFRQHYGFTITDYIRYARLNTVRKYLLSGQSFTQLSYELGFSDQSHFIREFRNFTGVSPNGFIKEMDRFSDNAV